jgi:putative ABC transport system permease protein
MRGFMASILRDIYRSVSVLYGAKLFTFTVVFIIAISTALNAVVFGVVDAILIRPLQYDAPDQLITLHVKHANGESSDAVPFQTFRMLQQTESPLESLAAIYPIDVGVNLAARGGVQYMHALRISPDLFPVLRTVPAMGRNFSPNDEQAGLPGPVLLSHDAWRLLFRGARFHDGYHVYINGDESNVIGVLPEGFTTYPQADLWLPLSLQAGLLKGSNYIMIGRLKPGVTIQQAARDFYSLSKKQHLADMHNGATILVPLQFQEAMTEGVRKGILAVLAGAIFLFLIASTNVAILVSVRNMRRKRELAIRAALGATKPQLVRWLFAEGAILALLGGMLGMVMAKEALPFVLYLIPKSLPFWERIRLNWPVVLYVAGATLFIGIYLGLAGAAQLARVDITAIIKNNPARPLLKHSARAPSQLALVRAMLPLLSTRTALSIVLLTGSFLVIRRYTELKAMPIGFDPKDLWVAQVLLSADKYATTEATSSFLKGVLKQLNEADGIERAASVNGLPSERGLNLPIYGLDPQLGSQDTVNYRIVSADFFSAMKVPIHGDLFHRDDGGGDPVTIVDATLAGLLWPHRSSVGRKIRVSDDLGPLFKDSTRRVIGVASDVYAEGWMRDEAAPTVYIPLTQTSDSITKFANQNFLTSLVIRTKRDTNLLDTVRAAVASADPALPVVSLMPMTDLINASLARPHLDFVLAGTTAPFAIMLGLTSIVGLLNFLYSHRSREIAIRFAVGARRSEIFSMILADGLKLSLAGAIPGVAGALFLDRTLQRVIYKHPSGIDFGVILFSIAIPTTIDAVASIMVALEVSSVNLMTILRDE